MPKSSPKLSDIDTAGWRELLNHLRAPLSTAKTLEQASQILARQLFTEIEGSVALIRVYAVLPYKDLEDPVRDFVDGAAANSRQAGSELLPSTPVLALMGTHGTKTAWCDRKTSKGHLGIPLISEPFVQSIPMVARLLKELGVELHWLDHAPEVNARRLLGGFNGVFFVQDAKLARDGNSRLIIPAQDFVDEQNIKTVFGMGGFFPDNTLVTIIFFCTEWLEREEVDKFKSLVSVFKGEASKLVLGRKFFASGGS